MIYKFYGPPGTGKTYRLISRAKAYVRIGTPLDNIAYFAFTKKAAGEARDRMPADNDKLAYFRTIHSFAYDQLELNDGKVMQPSDYEAIGKEIGVKVKYYDKYNKEDINYLNCDSPYFQMIGRAINRDISIRDEYDRGEHNKKEIKWKILKTIDDNLKEYKRVKKKLDFNDMIKQLIEKESLPRFKVIFIDEAQDLSPLQWKLFDKLKEHTDDIYLAGDDDQAIFAWAGADVDRFISQKSDQEKVLKYSKRISRAVQEQSEIPIEKIEGLRKQKDYYPRNYEGECEYINNLDHVDLTTRRWVILTRTISRLVSMKKELRERNLYYQTKKEKSFKVRVYNAHINYNSWCRGKILDEKEWKDVEEYIGKKMEDWDPDLDWFDAFKEVEYEDKEYIREMMENGEDLDLPARIFISTIHAFEGGEQDNVILCLDQPNKIKKAVRKSKNKSDEEHRVWYVGITRARNNLYKLKAKKKVNAYKL